MDPLARLIACNTRPDGTAPASEAVATGLRGLDAGPAPLAAMPLPAVPLPAAAPLAGHLVLREAVLAKVLHGWLQNRHQTLFPLSVNLAALDAAQRATLAGMAAVALLADDEHAPDHGEREARTRRWLVVAGADPATLAALDDALARPPATSSLLATVAARDIAPTAYVAALVATDTRSAAGLHFLDYLAARLALPATLVRSANRRYRR